MPKIDMVGKKYGGFPALIKALEDIETQITKKMSESSQQKLSPELTLKSAEVQSIEGKLKRYVDNFILSNFR